MNAGALQDGADVEAAQKEPAGVVPGTERNLRIPVIDLTGVAGATLSLAQSLEST